MKTRSGSAKTARGALVCLSIALLLSACAAPAPTATPTPRFPNAQLSETEVFELLRAHLHTKSDPACASFAALPRSGFWMEFSDARETWTAIPQVMDPFGDSQWRIDDEPGGKITGQGFLASSC